MSIPNRPAFPQRPLHVALRAAFLPLAMAGVAVSASAQVPETVMPAVTVTATTPIDSAQHLKARVNGGALGARSQLETPFSSTMVTAEDLAERQVTKLGDVFALDASVSDNSGAYSSWASYVTVRGLALDWQNAYRIDGKPFLSYAITLPYEHFEQIELLKGLSGFMYGFGAPGGLVNYVTKKPTDTPVRSVAVGFKSNSVWSEHVDLGGRFGADDKFGYRLNATHEDGETFNDGSIKRDSVSLALDARLTRDLSWNFETIYQKRHSKDQTPSIFTTSYAGTGLPAVIADDNQKMVGDGQFLKTELQYYSTGLKYQLAPDWALSTNVSHSTSKRARNEGSAYLLNRSGDYDDVRSDTKEGHQFDQWSAMLQGKAVTGAMEHQLVLGVSWQKQLNDYSTNAFYGSIGTGNIHTQNQNAYASVTDLDLYRDSDITQKAIFASDTLKLSDRWSILAGLRHTDFKQNSYGIDGVKNPSYEKSVTTPTAAVMFKLEPNTTLYASYVESLEQGSRAGVSYANNGQSLAPLESKQYEVGIKTAQERWSATAALFRIERGAEYVNSSNVLVQDGESIFQGLELAASARLGTQWDVLGNLMLLDTSYEKGGDFVGNRVAGAPNFVAAAQVGYRVAQLPGLRLSADAKYTGSTMLRASNTLKLPSYTVLNAGANYSTRVAGHDTTFRVAVNNIADKKYWEYQYSDWIKPADPRTFSVSVKVDF